jgi:purine-nucleoside phosphorylase
VVVRDFIGKLRKRQERIDSMQNFEDVQSAAHALRTRLPREALQKAPIGLILGTGLSGLVDEMDDSLDERVVVPCAQLPNFPVPGIDSHKGFFVWGRLRESRTPVLIQQGRCHLYEGRTPAQVCMGVRVMAELGAGTLVITNVAGALNPRFEAGDIMCISDQINNTGLSPLTGKNRAAWGEPFPDMSAPFDRRLQELALATAAELKIRLERGVYIGVHGPELETPAETRAYRQWGADAIGMSSVLEVIAARHLGMRVLGISCLTNKNLPDCMLPVSLEEIIAVAERAGANLSALVRAVLPVIN